MILIKCFLCFPFLIHDGFLLFVLDDVPTFLFNLHDVRWSMFAPSDLIHFRP